MPDLALHEWLGENSLRPYPLVRNYDATNPSIKIPNDLILDALFVVDSPTTRVSINKIIINSNFAQIFVDTLPPNEFTIDKSRDFPQSIRLSNGNLLVAGEGAKYLPEGEYLYNGGVNGLVFENSVVIPFQGKWKGVNTITAESTALSTSEIELIQGSQVKLTPTEGVVVVAAGSSYGIPVTCTESVANCSNILSFVNDVSGSTVYLTEGQGISVIDDPENHRIFIGLKHPTDSICKPINPNLIP